MTSLLPGLTILGMVWFGLSGITFTAVQEPNLYFTSEAFVCLVMLGALQGMEGESTPCSWSEWALRSSSYDRDQ